jgi:hypothetical protein
MFRDFWSMKKKHRRPRMLTLVNCFFTSSYESLYSASREGRSWMSVLRVDWAKVVPSDSAGDPARYAGLIRIVIQILKSPSVQRARRSRDVAEGVALNRVHFAVAVLPEPFHIHPRKAYITSRPRAKYGCATEKHEFAVGRLLTESRLPLIHRLFNQKRNLRRS